MPVSGLALTLSDDQREQQHVLAALGEDPRISVGVREGRRLAIVVDTPSSDEDREVWQWINALPGVSFVDVVCVHFTEPDEPQTRATGQDLDAL